MSAQGSIENPACAAPSFCSSCLLSSPLFSAPFLALSLAPLSLSLYRAFRSRALGRFAHGALHMSPPFATPKIPLPGAVPCEKKRTSAPWALCLAASCPTMSMLFFERRGSVSGCEINAHFRSWPRMRARQPCLVGARWNLPRRVWHVASVRFFRTGRERFRVPCKIYTRPQVFCTSWQARRRAAPRKILAPGDCFRFPVAPPSSLPRQGRGERGGFVKRGQLEIPKGVYPRRRSSPRELGRVW